MIDLFSLEFTLETVIKTIRVRVRVRVRRVRKIYFDNDKHDIEETNTETFMCRSMSFINDQ